MTRRVPGYFHAQAATDGPPAPYVNVDVGPAPEPWSIAFLIDTGAEITTLGPRDSLTLLGRSYLTIDFSSIPGTREMIGIGQGSSRSFITPTELTFFADDGSQIRITLGIAITEPVPPDPGAQGNWRMPSLLGRDVLQHFDLSLSYHPPSVTLTEASESS